MSKDMHEQLLKDFEQLIIGKIPDEYVDMTVSCMIIAADKYEVQERCTEISIVDSSNEMLMKMYLSNCIVEGKRKRTIERYAYELKHFDQTVCKPFEKITTLDIRKYFALMIHRGASKRTAENTRSCLAPFFRFLATEELIEKDPMLKIKPIKHEEHQEEPFPDIEIAMLRDACKDAYDRALIEFLLSTGVRVSEAISMKKTDVDHKNNTVYVRNGKGGKDRKTYITDVGLKYLDDYIKARKDEDDVLFRSKNGGGISYSGIKQRLKKIAKIAGVQNVHPHRFRHTFASNLARAGMSLQEIQILLGHANIETTRIYVTTTQEQVKSRYMQIA